MGIKIVVNGREHELEEGETTISHERICEIAKQPEYASVAYSWRGDGDMSRSGSTYKGKSVEVAEGMRIDCIVTGNA